MRPQVQFLEPVNSNSKPQNVYLRKFLVLSDASLLLGLVMPPVTPAHAQEAKTEDLSLGQPRL